MQNQKGFTLIEVMITVAVVSISMIGLLYANTKIQHSAQSAFQRSVAMQEAHRVMEEIRLFANTPSSCSDFPTCVSDSSVAGSFPHNTARTGFTSLPAYCGGMQGTAAACTWPFTFTAKNTSQEQIVVRYTDGDADGLTTTDNPLEVEITVVYMEEPNRPAYTTLKSLITSRS